MKKKGWLAAALLSAVLGCRGADSNRVIVLGLDGMDPRAVDLLMSEGKLPNFARLRQEGSYGHLLAVKPMLSPILWTTMATGKPPTEHGIGHFTAVDERGESLPVTREMRRVKAVWNILSEQKRKVAVVGWWATWPAEEVNGVVVSDHTCYHFLFRQGETGEEAGSGVTHPPGLFKELEPLIRRPSDITSEEAGAFIQVSPEELSQPFDFSEDVSHFKWALATAESYRKIGLELWRRERPDLLMVYVEATDSVSHLFGHLFRAGELHGELAEQQRKFGSAVERMYLYADRLVGEYMDVMDRNTTLMVVSDHGFELGSLQDDPSKTRDLRRVSEKYHRSEGIVYLYGKGAKRHGRIESARQIDVTPTLLALFGVPPGKDMPGDALADALDEYTPLSRVASYETGSTPVRSPGKTDAVDAEILKHLEALGYVGGSSSPGGERNLAALHFEAGRYEEAAQAYRRLVEANPEDARLRTSLAGALGALGRLDEAEEQLRASIELDPLNAEAYHNLAVIEERRGRPEEAVSLYRTAVKYQPNYEPSERALLRLTGSAEARRPRDEKEAKAWALAEQASRAARRGDYTSATALLDEAENLSPDSVLVLQYRSNVAYLKGDTKAAIEALEKALELEPENALFQTNLERLRGRKP